MCGEYIIASVPKLTHGEGRMITSGSIEIIANSSFPALKNGKVSQEEQQESSIVNTMGNGDTVSISTEARDKLAAVQAAGESAGATGESGAGQGVAPSAAAGGGETGVAAVTADATDNESEIEDLQAQISSLRQEIAALSTQATGAGGNQAEIASKQAELAGLLAQLVQLQSA